MKKIRLTAIRAIAAAVFVFAFMLNIHTNLEGETSLFGKLLVANSGGSGNSSGAGSSGGSGGSGTSGSGGSGSGTDPGLFGEYQETRCEEKYDKWVEQSSETIITFTQQTNTEVAGEYRLIFSLTGQTTVGGKIQYTYTKTTYGWVKAKEVRCKGWWPLCGYTEKDCGE